MLRQIEAFRQARLELTKIHVTDLVVLKTPCRANSHELPILRK